MLVVASEPTIKSALVAQCKECADEHAVLICASVINVGTDPMALLIPMFAIWVLQIPLAKNVKAFCRLSADFAVGAL